MIICKLRANAINSTNSITQQLKFGESSNGRTADSGSAYRGSNPLSPAT